MLELTKKLTPIILRKCTFILKGISMQTIVYIDGANLHQGAKARWGLDYARFFKWLQDKYKVYRVYLFLWYIKGNEALYSQLSNLGYTLIFKETLDIWWKVKGNVDAELVVQAMMNFYEQHSSHSILVTGDGDFACLIDFFINKSHFIRILAPNREYLSYLIKKRNVPITFLEELAHKIKKSPH